MPTATRMTVPKSAKVTARVEEGQRWGLSVAETGRGRTRRNGGSALLASQEQARGSDSAARHTRQQASRQEVVVGDPQRAQDERLQDDEADT